MYICTLYFLIFPILIKSIINIDHAQYSWCAIYRDPTVIKKPINHFKTIKLQNFIYIFLFFLFFFFFFKGGRNIMFMDFVKKN